MINNIRRYLFSNGSKLNLQHFLRVQKATFQLSNDDLNVELKVPKQTQNFEELSEAFEIVSFNVQKETTIGDFAIYMKEKEVGNKLTNRFFHFRQGSNSKKPFYMVASPNEMYFFQNKDGYSQDQYQQMKALLLKTEVPLMMNNIILSYLKRVDNIVSLNMGTKLFSDQDTLTRTQKAITQIEKDKYVQALLDAYPDMRNTQSDHEAELFESFYKLSSRHKLMREQRRKLMEFAEKQTKFQMFGGFMVLIGHFAFMASGIYVYFNWDVMEPIGYFLNTGGAIYISYQYFKLDAEWTHGRLSRYLIMKNFKKLSKRVNYDESKLDEVNQELELIRGRIKTNIITNL